MSKHMNRHFKLALGAVLFSAAALAQNSILAIDIENLVIYNQDTSDITKWTSNPEITDPIGGGNQTFVPVIWLADVVAVNGVPAKGTWTARGTYLFRSTTLTPGRAIADSSAAFIFDWMVDLILPDGRTVGTIMATGWGGTGKTPSGPSSFLAGNMTIVGGTGAYLGIRGQAGQGGNTISPRDASMREDPAYRRILGGGKRRYVFHIIPLESPQITGIFHGDFTPVTASSPARVGETLIAQATGLGPTLPGVDPGQPFPTTGLQEVNSPVDVMINGKASTVLNKVGWPGRIGAYRLDFQVPDGTSSGTATIQLSAAWIEGPSAFLPVR
jgi:hypothetical protein